MANILRPIHGELPRGKIFYTQDGSPLRRATPKVKMSKKERLKLRAIAKASNKTQEIVKSTIVDEVLDGKAEA